MATKRGFETTYKSYYIYKCLDQSGNTYYIALDSNNKFFTSGESVEDVQSSINMYLNAAIIKANTKTR